MPLVLKEQWMALLARVFKVITLFVRLVGATTVKMAVRKLGLRPVKTHGYGLILRRLDDEKRRYFGARNRAT